MARSIFVRFNEAFFKSLLKSSVTQHLLRQKGEALRSRADSMYNAKGYGCKVKVGKNRARAIVYTGNLHTMRSNHAHNTLRKVRK